MGKLKNIKQIFVICYGNIARSQILEIYLNKFLKELDLDNIEVYSAGTAPYEVFPDTFERIKEVEEKLRERGVNVKLERTPWSEEVCRRLEKSDIILVADEKIKKKILEELDKNIPKDNVYTFYEFIGEGEKDFEDTYNYEKRCQNHIKFDKAFDELERIARKIIAKLQHE